MLNSVRFSPAQNTKAVSFGYMSMKKMNAMPPEDLQKLSEKDARKYLDNTKFQDLLEMPANNQFDNLDAYQDDRLERYYYAGKALIQNGPTVPSIRCKATSLSIETRDKAEDLHSLAVKVDKLANRFRKTGASETAE